MVRVGRHAPPDTYRNVSSPVYRSEFCSLIQRVFGKPPLEMFVGRRTTSGSLNVCALKSKTKRCLENRTSRRQRLRVPTDFQRPKSRTRSADDRPASSGHGHCGAAATNGHEPLTGGGGVSGARALTFPSPPRTDRVRAGNEAGPPSYIKTPWTHRPIDLRCDKCRRQDAIRHCCNSSSNRRTNYAIAGRPAPRPST